ncbi:MAG: hypothetical protein IJ196_07315, partial [Prevotella sp.]|nr:hypothetical protein [Prevotella sp.]
MKKVLLLFFGILFSGLMFAADTPNVVVVDDISVYTGSDPYVFNKKDNKVYVLNNIGEYEQYGIVETVSELKAASGTDTEISYIETRQNMGSKPYIQTGYIHKSNTRVVIDCEVTAHYRNWEALFGARRNSFQNNAFVVFSRADNDNHGVFCRSGKEEKFTEEIPLNERIVVDAAGLEAKVFKASDLENPITVCNSTGTSNDGVNQMYIFELNTADTGGDRTDGGWAVMKLYSFKVYEGETLVMDLVPFVNGAGRSGLKDKISGRKMFSADAAGDFFVSEDGNDAVAKGGSTVYEGKLFYNTTDQNQYKYTNGQFVKIGPRTLAPVEGDGYKNLNNWTTNNDHKGVFEGKITYDEETHSNRLSPYVGTGGWEPLWYKQVTEAGADYNISLTYSGPQWNSWSNYTYLPFAVLNNENFDNQDGLQSLGGASGVVNFAKLPQAATENLNVAFDFTAQQDFEMLVLQFGVVDDGDKGFWFQFDNLNLQKYVYSESYPTVNPFGPQLELLIPEIEAYEANTTEVLAQELASALEEAKRALENTEDLAGQKAALERLKAAYQNAKDNDVTVLKATVALAKAEGIDVSSFEDFLVNGTSGTDYQVYVVRSMRKLNAADKQDVANIVGSEPVDGEEYYLLNVGTGLFFSTTADWSTHIAIDNPGFLIKFVRDGNSTVNTELPAFHLSGAGFNGMNWNEEYWDKNGEHKWTFVPVEGKTNVYYMNVFDNYDWHVVYDVTDGRTDGPRFWNALKKRNNNTYKEDLNAQWVLLTEKQRTELLKTANANNPVDATHLITNPDFTYINGGQEGRGWEGLGAIQIGDRRSFQVVEFWNADNVNMKTTVEGLPAGYYTVAVNGFYRDGDTPDEVAKVVNGETLNQLASLVAYTSDDNKVSVLLPNVTSEAGKMPGVGESRDGVNGEFVIWPAEANEYFATGLYKVTTPVIAVGADGKLTLGIEKEGKAERDWIVVDNFRLVCLGLAPVLDENADNTPVIENAGEVKTVVMKRSTVADTWNTLCVPFDLTEEQITEVFGEGTQVAELNAAEDNTELV